ncbi:hypothetical protein GGF37_006351, partial [Kickxella alabastrina]
IKKMKKRRWKDTAAQAEISALQKLHHENIIRLLDVFREDYRSFLVFECMDCDLNELVVSRHGRRIPDTVILDITYQVLNGLDFIHKNELFHRDIKPENVLIRRHITSSGGPGGSSAIVVEAKIADFGLVHDLDFSRPLTDYISTRWYRAPEVLLNCPNYSTPIDVWAVGTIVAELATLRPLFPGSNQIDQLRRIFEVLGTPKISTPAVGQMDDGADSAGSWYEGAVHARKLGINFVPSTRKPLDTVMTDVSPTMLRLVDHMLVLNPVDRPTAQEALALVSSMLDHTLGEPLVPSQSMEMEMGMEMQVVPADNDDMEMEMEDSRRVSQDLSVGSTKSRTSPTFGPVGKDTVSVAVNPGLAAVERASRLDKTFAHAAQLQQQQPVVSAFPDTAAMAVAIAKLAATKEDQAFPDTAAMALAISKLAATKEEPATVQDGRISFTPRDKFTQQLINGQIKQHNTSADPLTSLTTKTISPPPVMTSRPSMEVNIVRGLQREPMRDPRADLSAFAIDPLRRGMGGRLNTVSTVGSIPSYGG